ncbi:hypothetical protein [Phenylobacterium sp.]|uniref:hypothetical protein n=1 Tax=Phenylobacterium sp. TaxID=1871053 RepID=UPI0035B040D9
MRPIAAATAATLGLLAALPAGAASINLAQDFEARGANPAWTLRASNNTFTLSRPGRPDLVAQAPGAAIAPPKASWAAATADGQPVAVSFTFAPCTSGEVRGPIMAEVTVGGETLRGCATPRPASPAAAR